MSVNATNAIPIPAAASSDRRSAPECGRLGARQSGRQASHHRDGEPEHGDRCRRSDDGHEDSGEPRPETTECQDHHEGGAAQGKRGRIGGVDTARQRPQLADQGVRLCGEPEHLRQLADEDRERQAVQIADPDRLGEELRHEPGPGQAGQHTHHPRDHRDQTAQRKRLRRPGGRHGQNRRRDQRRHGAVGADHEDPRRTDQRIHRHRHHGCVDARDRGHARQLRVRHSLRDEQRSEHNPGDDVVTKPLAPVADKRCDAREPTTHRGDPTRHLPTAYEPGYRPRSAETRASVLVTARALPARPRSPSRRRS